MAESTTGSSKLARELGGPPGGAMGTIAPVLAAVGALVSSQVSFSPVPLRLHLQPRVPLVSPVA